jgi:hypothetical protein
MWQTGRSTADDGNRRRLERGLRTAAGLALSLLLLADAPWLQARQAAVAPNPPARDISGFWELNFDSRKVPAANLLPSVTRARIDEHLKADAKAVRWCNLLGMPFTMDSGRPLDIRQGATAVIIVPENSSSQRYLYLNRTAHISPDIFDPSTVGDSIAHWEGDTLVVDTVGFHPDRGITAIPGGGYRTDTSHLVERFRLLKGGAILSVTFTWTDPKVFRSPHSYEFRYYRLPASYEARQWLPCDPYDAERAAFLEPSPPTTPAPSRPGRGRGAAGGPAPTGGR